MMLSNNISYINEIRFGFRAITWKRTIGGRHINPELQNYYYRLWAELKDAGVKPLDMSREYGIFVVCKFITKHWPDCDNLLKAICDSGQPSKWAGKLDKAVMQDFWDDRIFAEKHIIRVRGADENSIEIKIWEVEDE